MRVKVDACTWTFEAGMRMELLVLCLVTERRRGHPGGVASVATPSDGEQAKLSVAPHSGEGTWPTSAC